MQASSDFFHLCHEQLNLLVHGLGASLTIVALAERPTQQADSQNLAFVPVVTYPDGFSSIDPQALMMWLSEVWITDIVSTTDVEYADHPASTHSDDTDNPLLSFPRICYEGRGQSRDSDGSKFDHSDGSDDSDDNGRLQSSWNQIDQSGCIVDPAFSDDYAADDITVDIGSSALEYRSPLAFHQERMVLPLIYQDMMMGMLVTARMDRGWSQGERYEIERIAQTLATACMLDQRSQWLEKRFHQQSMAYAQLQDHQQDRLDDILHQFRNPLTALRTFGKLLIRRLQLSDRNRTVAESIVRESDRLQDLLTQLSETVAMTPPALPDPLPLASSLNLSDLPSEPVAVSMPEAEMPFPSSSSGTGSEDTLSRPASPDASQQTVKALLGQTIQVASYSVLDILAPLLTSATAIAQDRQMTLHVAETEPLVPVKVDARALREVLNNLLDNALKYTPTGGQVGVIPGIEGEPEPDGRRYQGLAIADTGPGIPLEDQCHLFERHFRGIQADSNIPGTGLGLAIAQVLMQQMQGRIEVFSPATACPIPLPFPLTSSPDSQLCSESLSLDQSVATDNPSSGPDLQPPGTIFIVWMVSLNQAALEPEKNSSEHRA